jgi:hypothetical protein
MLKLRDFYFQLIVRDLLEVMRGLDPRIHDEAPLVVA